MNYRHIYHAGNFADIFKHFIVFLILTRLLEKPTAFMVLDAFAGVGRYPLNATEPQKTGEYKTGIEPFMQADFANPHLREFQNFLRAQWDNKFYAGSPLQIQSLLRPQDRLLANELHPDDFKSLSLTLGHFKNVYLSQIDAYTAVKAAIPPIEKRGFILVDPPFEKRNEFEILIKNIEVWNAKFPQGHYALWYPIKAHDLSLELNAQAQTLNMHRTYRLEFLRYDRAKPDSFNGCGMLLLNAPFTVVEHLSDAKTELEKILGGVIEIELLTTV